MNEPEDLEALLRELHDETPTPLAGPPTRRAATGPGLAERGLDAAGTGADRARLDAWLRELASRRASDLLLVAGAPPAIRVDGRVVPLGGAPLDGATIEATVLEALPVHAAAQYRDVGIADASYRLVNAGRFRINLHRERGRAAAAIRALPSEVPRLASLHLPPGVEALSLLTRGLVLDRRPDRVGQVDDPGGAGRRDQPP